MKIYTPKTDRIFRTDLARLHVMLLQGKRSRRFIPAVSVPRLKWTPTDGKRLKGMYCKKRRERTF